MSITDELRTWMYGHTVNCSDNRIALVAIADRIDAEHKKACDDAWDNGYEADYLGIEKWLTEHPQAMEHHGWIRLPKDADGEYINIGDMMEWPDGETFDVIGIGDGVLFYTESECDGPAEWTGASNKRHYHAPTVEDVLREFALAVCKDDALTIHKGVVEEYAKRLKLAEGEDA